MFSIVVFNFICGLSKIDSADSETDIVIIRKLARKLNMKILVFPKKLHKSFKRFSDGIWIFRNKSLSDSQRKHALWKTQKNEETLMS